MSIVVIDYGLGNIKSVLNALGSQAEHAILSNDSEVIMNADGVILPGVGSFPYGMSQLKYYGLVDTLKSYAQSGKPLLGICLGMQMLLTSGQEFEETPGLGLVAGQVIPLLAQRGLQGRVPHVGWSGLEEGSHTAWNDTIFRNLGSKSVTQPEVYFVHSFVADPALEKNILATTSYQGVDFCSAIRSGNVYGCQFHPEKSGAVGLKVLKNFLSITKEFKDEETRSVLRSST